MKFCRKCQETKHITDFYANPKQGGGWCRACWNAYSNARNAAKRPPPVVKSHPTAYCCTGCGESKPATTEYFPVYRGATSGLRRTCLVCYEAGWRERNRHPKVLHEYEPEAVKTCCVCHQEKSVEEFKKSRRMLYGADALCKTCHNGRSIEYNARPEVAAARKAKYDAKDPDIRREKVAAKWAQQLIRSAEQSGPKRGLGPCELTVQDVLDLFTQQEGRCHWFGVELLPTAVPRHPQQPSLDRIDCQKGYVVGNVVLTCLAANIGRGKTDAQTWATFCTGISLGRL